MLDTFLDIMFPTYQGPAESEFDLAAYMLDLFLHDEGERLTVLHRRLLVLPLLVIALAFEEVEHVSVLRSHQSLALRALMDGFIYLAALVIDLSQADTNWCYEELLVHSIQISEVGLALVIVAGILSQAENAKAV